jgi:ankyrin repeat protein
VLQCTVTEGDEYNIDQLSRHGADINDRGHAADQGEDCANIAAVSCGHAHIVRLLLDRGAKIEGIRSHFGDLLQTTCAFGFTNVLEVLLDMQPPGLD